MAYFTLAAWPAISGDYVINNDCPQHLLWLFDVEWAEPFYADTSGLIQSWGYYAFNGLLSTVFSPWQLSTFGPLLTLAVAVGFAFASIRKFTAFLPAFLIAILLGHFGYPAMVGYFARAFCLPVLCIFMYYWLTDNHRGIMISWLLAALFYPPALLITLGVAGLHWLVRLAQLPFREKISEAGEAVSSSPKWTAGILPPALLVAALMSISVVLFKSENLRQHAWIGPFFPAEVITSSPEFTYNGRVNFVHELKTTTPQMLRYSVQSRLKLPGGNLPLYVLGGIFLFAAWWDRQRPIHRLDNFILAYLISAATLHFLAQLLVPRLFVPDRFLSYPGALLAALLLFRGLATLKSSFLNAPATVALLTALLLLWLPNNRKIQSTSLDNYAYLSEVYEAADSLAEGALISAPPWVADNIPFFSQQSVLLSNESAHALYFQRYHAFIDQRWRAYIPAYTAGTDEADVLLAFLRAYRVSHLLVDRINLGEGNFYAFEPYQSLYRETVDGRTAADYLLLQIPRHVGRRLTERYQLYRREELEAYLEQAGL